MPKAEVQIRTKLAYILAASHSGSTLLAMLLGAHPDVCTTGELKIRSLGDVERYRCGCGELIRQCGFWKQVSLEMHRRGFSFDVSDAGTDIRTGVSALKRRLLRPLHRGPALETMRDVALALTPGWRRHRDDIQDRNVALVETIAHLSDARMVVDSSKLGLRLKYLLHSDDLDIRVIRLIRDGRAVAMTYTNPAEFADATDPRLRGGGMGGDRAGERLSMRQAAHEWRRSSEEAEAVMAGLEPSDVVEVRYEALCGDPVSELSKIAALLEVDPHRFPPDFRSVEQHIVGNGMRLDSTSEVRLDERWRKVLSPSELRDFDAVAGEMNRRYGYE